MFFPPQNIIKILCHSKQRLQNITNIHKQKLNGLTEQQVPTTQERRLLSLNAHKEIRV